MADKVLITTGKLDSLALAIGDKAEVNVPLTIDEMEATVEEHLWKQKKIYQDEFGFVVLDDGGSEPVSGVALVQDSYDGNGNVIRNITTYGGAQVTEDAGVVSVVAETVIKTQGIYVTSDKIDAVVTPDEGSVGFTEVRVNAVPAAYGASF